MNTENRSDEISDRAGEGMSGAAVWVGDRLVGVLARHHHSDGLGRLAAARLDLILAGFDRQRQAELRPLPGLPDALPDAVPPSAGEQVRFREWEAGPVEEMVEVVVFDADYYGLSEVGP